MLYMENKGLFAQTMAAKNCLQFYILPCSLNYAFDVVVGYVFHLTFVKNSEECYDNPVRGLFDYVECQYSCSAAFAFEVIGIRILYMPAPSEIPCDGERSRETSRDL